MVSPEKLWVGPNLKLQHAQFFLKEMARSLEGPERANWNVALVSSGAIIDTRWQQSFYAYLDAFLAMARSVPEIINCCFGKDRHMTAWFRKLKRDEQDRRHAFTLKFEAGGYKKFREHPLAIARNVTFHRAGYPSSVEVTLKGWFGVYSGNAVTGIPLTETRPLPEGDPHGWLVKPRHLEPMWNDFTFDGEPLFPACQSYVALAGELIEQAQKIVQSVHEAKCLTPPP